MILLNRIERLLEDPVKDLGYEIVEIVVRKVNNKTVMEITIERTDMQPIGIDDCVKAHKKISRLLNVHDPIKGPYILQVTSPGLNRPLRNQKDFQRFINHSVIIHVDDEKLKGVIKDVDSQSLILLLGEEEKVIPFFRIKKARLKQ